LERRSERRLVSCVFIDIVGSTDMGQRLGPERMQRLLADSFREISAIATAAGGTIEKYIGDEVFVLFGAPAAHSFGPLVRFVSGTEFSARALARYVTKGQARVTDRGRTDRAFDLVAPDQRSP